MSFQAVFWICSRHQSNSSDVSGVISPSLQINEASLKNCISLHHCRFAQTLRLYSDGVICESWRKIKRRKILIENYMLWSHFNFSSAVLWKVKCHWIWSLNPRCFLKYLENNIRKFQTFSTVCLFFSAFLCFSLISKFSTSSASAQVWGSLLNISAIPAALPHLW